MADEEVVLRPLSFKPGGGGAANPFAAFGKGAGATLKPKAKEAAVAKEIRKKNPSDIVRYGREFMLRFSEHYIKMPSELVGLEITVDVIETKQPTSEAAAAAVSEPTDTRDWRTRQPLPAGAEGTSQPQAAPQSQPQTGANGQGDWQQSGARGAPAAAAQPRAVPQKAGASGKAGAGGKAGTAAGGAASGKPASDSQAGAQAPPRIVQQPRSLPVQQPAAAAGQPAAAASVKIVTAADKGLKAWQPGGASAAQGTDKALKVVKGVLNKLTPEKFERLLQQLLQAVNSVDILAGTITLVFENAVAQPTFVSVYADLCARLAESLPSFPPPEGEHKPMTFKRVLLNTCQEEFEGAAEAQTALASVPEDQREAAERRVKMRTLGNIRLISELYKKEVVQETILHVCMAQMIGDTKQEPLEDNVEALCEMLTIAGKKLDESDKGRKKLEGYFVLLEKWAKSPLLAARIRFMIRDVIELRRSKWIPRRETLQAKKLDEIHAEAHAELGMVPVTLMPTLQLPALPRLQQEDVELFPAFRGDADWKHSGGLGAIDGKFSAFVGNYTAVPTAAAKPADKPAEKPAEKPAAAPAPAPAASTSAEEAAMAGPRYAKDMKPEEREEKAGQLFDEFLSSNDTAEALNCVRDLSIPGFMPKIVEVGINKMYDSMRDKEHDMLAGLLVALAKKGAYSAEDFLTGLHTKTDMMEDLSLDIPKAPSLTAKLTARAIIDGVIGLDKLADLSEKIESAEPRRTFVALTLRAIKMGAGEERFQKLLTDSGFKAGELLKADPEFDPADLPDVASFLKQEGLAAVPV
ncbi:hypothetical protein WJX72_008106 [[Myrmecia] bisecta]|uniref:MI domain-containing protein n=1 Tax=[Myrmecia] bisecta TaxID=41462 RepID=A0AAW1QFQ9_9CHLO